MRTTTRRSERREARTDRIAAAREARTGRVAAASLAIGAALALAACVPPPTDPGELLQLSPESAAHKAMQTRTFETRDDTELLSASAAVLQDLGFQVTESVRELGFLRAAKERSAREYGQELTRAFVLLLTTTASVLGGSNGIVLIPVDVHQQIHASLVARPLNEAADRFEVRVLFYRLVWKGDGQSGDNYVPPGEQRMEMIRDAGIYQAFFARLSKAVFLEAHTI